MTDPNPSDRDVHRAIRTWLHEDRHEDSSRVAGAVLDDVDTTPQRRAWWPAWRTPTMNKFVPIGLGVAAVVVVAVVGVQLLGPTASGGVGAGSTPSPEPSATSQPSVAAPSSPADGSLPNGPVVVTTTDDPVQVTVDIASSGWFALPQFDAVSKDDDGLDPPETVGAALLAWAWPAGTGFSVFGDPCQWATTIPETPATTPDEIATALSAQALTDAAAPVDVTIGGYSGKTITLRVPLSYDIPNASRERKFADCDNDTFAFYGMAVPGEEVARYAQGAGQIDELWILDVGGSIVILDAAYSPATPANLVEEIRTLAGSATFE